MEVKVDLDFKCCNCGARMSVTLKCAGQGLKHGLHAVAAVKVPCPNCTKVNQVIFEPSGTLHAVAPCPGPRRVPQPSLN
jgi:hypothetical protein